MVLREKLKLIRKKSKKTIPQFSEFVSIPMGTLSKYSSGEREVSGDAVLKIIDKFPQYALWLTLNEVAPEIGQVSPEDDAPQMGNAGVPAKLLDDSFFQTMNTAIALSWLTPKKEIEFSMLNDLFRHNFAEAGGVIVEQSTSEEESRSA